MSPAVGDWVPYTKILKYSLYELLDLDFILVYLATYYLTGKSGIQQDMKQAVVYLKKLTSSS